MTRPTVPAVAILPIRLFFGATFLFAGFDKLLDPSFFDPSAPTSIDAQLLAFARLSPLADLIRASLPLAGVIGLLIAIAEIGIGIGALTGLAFRVAAVGGAALSFLFFLTASWATHPYYFGADLPYAIGWLALAIAGHGDLWVPATIRRAFAGSAVDDVDGFEARPPGGLSARERRRRLAAKQPGRGRRPATVAAVAAALAAPLRAMGVFTEPLASPRSSETPNPSAIANGGSPTPAGGSPGSTPPPSGGSTVVAHLADVQAGGGSASFTVPFDAPAPLPAGDPGIIVQLADGSFVAFDAVCTHEGCTVGWDQQDGVILCPCHDAAFDPAHDAAVIQGPARTPLGKLPIVVDQAAGTISLAG